MRPDILQVCTVPVTLKLFTRGQITYLIEQGLSVSVACSPGPELDEVVQRDKVQSYPVAFTRAPSLLRDTLSLLRLMLLFRRIKPTVVHGSTSKAGPLSMIAAWSVRVPIRLYTLRGILIDRRRGRGQLVLKAAEWLACRCAHQVIAVSRSVAQVMINEGLCPPDKIKVLGKGSSNGVDAEGRFDPAKVPVSEKTALRLRLGVPEDVAVVGFAGRLVAGKGIAALSAAWDIVSNEKDDVRLLIIGAPELQAPVDEKVMSKLYADGKVLMIDWVSHDEIPVYYSIMDVVAFPSESEGFPNVVLEAAAMELPVVATRVTGCVDAVVDNITGTLVPEGDAASLARALLRYLAGPDLRRRHGQAARQRVLRDFRPTAVWEALYQEYARLLEKHGHAVSSAGSHDAKR